MTQTEIKAKIEKLKKAITVTENKEDKEMLKEGLKKLESKLKQEKKPTPKKKVIVSKKKTILKKTHLVDAKHKIGDWLVGSVENTKNVSGEVYDVFLSEGIIKYKLKDSYGNKNEKPFFEKSLKKSKKPVKKKKISVPKKPTPKKKVSIKPKPISETPILKKALKQAKTKDLTISKGPKKESHKIVTAFEKDIKCAVLVLNKERYIIKEKVDRKTKKVEKVKHSPAFKNARTIEKRIDEIFNSSIYDIAKTRKEKIEKKAFIDEIKEVKELTTLWLNEIDIIINQEAKSDLEAIKKLLKGLIRESRKNDPSDKYQLAGGLDKIAKKHGL